MERCRVCGLPVTKKDDLLICPSGHALQIAEEFKDATEIAPKGELDRCVRKIPKRKYDLGLEETMMKIGLDYLYAILKQCGVPCSFVERYASLIYTVLGNITVEKEAVVWSCFKRVLEVLGFLIKREYELKRNNYYTILDFKRKLRYDRHLWRFFKRAMNRLRYRFFAVAWTETAWRCISLTYVIRLLHRCFPGRLEFLHGVDGPLTRVGLESFCSLLGLTITAQMEAAFEWFIENVRLTEFRQTYSFVFADYLYGVFLYLYYLQLCKLELIDGEIWVVERPTGPNKTLVVQEFCCRELTFFNFKQLSYYERCMQDCSGSERPFWNPLEYPAAPFGYEKITRFSHSEVSIRIVCRIVQVVGVPQRLLFDMTNRLLIRYTKIKRHI
ncbi:hypothetical protein NEHOM01_1521 [Nematocida homosporus]|uniref:uncharacterized protein n=1 Tax=Nematocida homosporus TaxID=1912981 RepID=UPI00221E8760|nr:uncharacterized protein NEHOM01_1521 [Nematocida homosporus]KAI5186521.1 hypothetical protein NEHOM01_1521 [Nematocida homosporus]